MLEHLRIRNYALIDELKIGFGKGLNVLTGETGAGKSIIIGALNVILGEKASPELVRTGEPKAIVEALFDLGKNKAVKSVLEGSGIDHDTSEPLIVRREIMADGKSKNYVNSTPVPLQKLKEIGDLLVDIHGQHEHQSLLKVDLHMDLLDRFGGLDGPREELAGRYREYRALQERLEKLQMNEQEKARLQELLRFSIEEIEKAGLKPGEDLELDREFLVLSNQEKIFEAVEKGYSSLYADETSVHSRLGKLLDDLSDLEKYDSRIVEIKQKLEDSYYVVQDVVSLFKDYKSGFDFSPGRLDSVIGRIEMINRLKKKYGPALDDVLKYRDKCVSDLDSIEKSDEEMGKTREALARLEEELKKKALDLSGRRRAVAADFEKKITEELNELDMKKSRFHAGFSCAEHPSGIIEHEGKRYRLTEKGMDQVEFLISPNPGEELKPLRKIASGGEISRIMLALKIVFHDIDPVDTLIFDEIDTGIGGKTADVVGKKMRFLGKNRQVIVITHQAQIARYGEKHFFASKEIVEERTFTRLRDLPGNERVYEIARMIAGDKITETTLRHSKELLEI